jgi:hypothetical protein
LPLKRAYSDEINSLAQYSTKKIKKEAFLLAFKAAFNKLIIKENICAGFRGTRLVLYNLEAVILKLNVVLYTLTLLKLEDTCHEDVTSRPLGTNLAVLINYYMQYLGGLRRCVLNRTLLITIYILV